MLPPMLPRSVPYSLFPLQGIPRLSFGAQIHADRIMEVAPV